MDDVRHKAGAILSGHKLRMLDEAGIAVVEKERLDALERLYEDCTIRQRCERFLPGPSQKEFEKAIENHRALDKAWNDIDELLTQLSPRASSEATQGSSVTSGPPTKEVRYNA